jgi:uncharacterized membrane protein
VDDVELMNKIREGVKDRDLETALIQLVILRSALRELSGLRSAMHLATVVILAIWAYRFLTEFALALASIVLLACGYMFLRAFLSRREILKRFATRYKLK